MQLYWQRCPGLDLKRYECLISRQCACRIPITPSSSPPSSNHLHKRDIFVFILFRDCYEMGHQKNPDLKETYNKVLSPESDKKKTWPCPWIGRAWLSARRRTQRAQKHKRLQEECKMQRSTDAHLSTQNAQSNVHAQTWRLSRNWTDRTRLATLTPHLTSAKSDTSKGPRSVITSIGIGYTLITYYQ